MAGEKRKRVSKAGFPSLVFDVFQEEGWGQGGPGKDASSPSIGEGARPHAEQKEWRIKQMGERPQRELTWYISGSPKYIPALSFYPTESGFSMKFQTLEFEHRPSFRVVQWLLAVISANSRHLYCGEQYGVSLKKKTENRATI